ncbi:MAG TPA: LLM class flavin-dependent oxidoreductase [Xanthobacteraceae bacterium]|jgi:alkanesulfonate monooxygenase SsuD/methylene tetrahydromethanopterin reductase-like flavin-dependent oxidoreductase (luciferase family)
MQKMSGGITLSNRAVLLGLTTAADLIDLAEAAEQAPEIDSIWCGDAMFVNRRLDALTLLAAVAGRTRRVLIGPACMGSFALRDPLVFAYEWASLDVISNGRTRLVACAGGGAGPLWDAETSVFGIAPQDRRKRMIENMHVLRHLWTKNDEPFNGQFVKFNGVTLEPKPLQTPCPIWLATNAERLSTGQADSGGSELALTRVGKIADGWMTHSVSPKGFENSWKFILDVARQNGRDTSKFDNVLYHHVNINDARDVALADAKTFLDLYYSANYSKERIESWLTYGSPRDCIDDIKRYRGSGCNRITFRLSTMGDPRHQLKRLAEEVLPYIND